MKKITKKQMKKLKGKLGNMDYNLSDLNNSTFIPVTDQTNPKNPVCVTKAVHSDFY
jgi:hypothetical protein